MTKCSSNEWNFFHGHSTARSALVSFAAACMLLIAGCGGGGDDDSSSHQYELYRERQARAALERWLQEEQQARRQAQQQFESERQARVTAEQQLAAERRARERERGVARVQLTQEERKSSLGLVFTILLTSVAGGFILLLAREWRMRRVMGRAVSWLLAQRGRE